MPFSSPPATITWLPAAAAIYRLAFGMDGEPMQMGHDWGVPPDPWAVKALAARAIRIPWRPTEPPPCPAYVYRAAVRKLMRKYEVGMPGDIAAVVQYTSHVTAYHAAWITALADAEDRLTAAVRDGAVPAYGVSVNVSNADPGQGVHVPIPEALLQHPGRVIRLNGALCWRGRNHNDFGPHDAGPYFADVQVDAEALRRLRPPGPLPDAADLNPWDAMTWYAFGALRPLNLGSRPDSLHEPHSPFVETWDRHALRMGAWTAIDAAERELKALLRHGHVSAYGRQEAVEPDGQPAFRPEGIHVPIPAEAFLNQRWAFDSSGRMFERLTGDRWTVRNGRPVPRERMFFEVRIGTADIAAAWGRHIVEPLAYSDEPDVPTPQPFPSAPYVSAWLAATWRAFGHLDAPATLMRHRSFDQGTVQLPDEPDVAHAARLEQHQKFDTAEREVLDLLASGQVKAKGQRPALAASGEKLHHPNPEPVDIPASTFLSREFAFSPTADLIARLPTLSRLFPPLALRGSDADPSFPIYHNVLLETAVLRGLWEPKPSATELPVRLKFETTIAAERRFEVWLINRIKAAPDNPPGKDAIKREANAAGQKFSNRGFVRVWAKAVAEVNAPAWSKAGRKSLRRFDTPR